MKTFNLSVAGDHQPRSIQYHPIQVTVAGVTHHLGLHQYLGEWAVSHLESGFRVCRVHGRYKGIAVAIKDHTPVAEIRRLAQVALADRIESFGAEKFNQVVAAAAAKVASIQTPAARKLGL